MGWLYTDEAVQFGFWDVLTSAFQSLWDRLRDEPEIEVEDLPEPEEVQKYLMGDWLKVISSNIEAIR